MNNKAVFMIFAMGAAIGSAITWHISKKKYERLAQEEIDSVKKVFSKRETDHKDETEDAQTKEKSEVTEYAAKLRERSYKNYSNKGSENGKKENVNSMDKPYVISPEEYGEHDYYDRISLTYYADQVLTDDADELVEDVEDIVGFESLNHFGEYEDDSVFVRNDRLKCDYEILLDQRNYSDVVKKKPPSGGGLR